MKSTTTHASNTTARSASRADDFFFAHKVRKPHPAHMSIANRHAGTPQASRVEHFLAIQQGRSQA